MESLQIQIHQLRAEGQSWRAISRLLGKSRHAIRYAIDEHFASEYRAYIGSATI